MDREIIILSSSGTYFLSFIEIIKILDKNNIWPKNPKIYIGTSGGAFLSLILTLTDNIQKMNNKKLTKSKIRPNILNIINNTLRNGYLESPEDLKKYYLSILNENFPHYDFINMTFLDHYNLTKKFLIMNTVDLETKKTIQLDPFLTPDFKIIDALIATSCYWPFIGPYNLNNNKYIDGGFMNKIYLEALKSLSIKN